MASILHLFGEDVGGVDNTRYVEDDHLVVEDVFLDCYLPDVEVFHAFTNTQFAPLDTGLVVVVDRGGGFVVREPKVTTFEAEGHGALGAFVSGQHFSMGAAAGTLVLAEGIPGYWSPHPHDDIPAHGSIFPKGYFCAIRDGAANLGAPACVCVGGTKMGMMREGSMSIGVCFLVMSKWEVKV